MIYGLIIAAGNQSRFKMETPKALVKIGEHSLLDDNIRKMKTVCDEVFVVCSTTNSHYFDGYNTIVIESGMGCGDAVYKAIKSFSNLSSDDYLFVQWGDSTVDEELYREMILVYAGSMVIPCRVKAKPYVRLVRNSTGGAEVLFSKYGEKVSRGFHDLSVFYVNAQSLLRSSQEFVDKFFNGVSYEHRHGNEFQFLDLLNDTDTKCMVYSTIYNGFSFNTVEEMMKLGKR